MKTHHHQRHLHRLLLDRLRERELDREIALAFRETSGDAEKRQRYPGGGVEKLPEIAPYTSQPCAYAPAVLVFGASLALEYPF